MKRVENFQVMKMDGIYLFEFILSTPLKTQIVEAFTTIFWAQGDYKNNDYNEDDDDGDDYSKRARVDIKIDI